ncbi:MAG TPA: histidine kinase [Puia sp.]|nr:histidine kinase [Puia sp.]
MKRFNLGTGIPFSLLISVIAVVIRLVGIASADLKLYLMLTGYFFVFSLICWIVNVALIDSRWIRQSKYRKQKFYAVTLLFGGCLSIFCILLNSWLKVGFMTAAEIVALQGRNKLIVFFFRGMLFNLFNAFHAAHIRQMKDHEQSMIELEQLKQANLQANLSGLKAQLSPHFLFNTFNTLSSLTGEQQVKSYVDQLANVYRYLLDHHKHDLVELKRELDFTKSYLYIMQTRLESALEVSMLIEAGCMTRGVPPLTVQLLVENAIRHNIASVSKPLRISIRTQDGSLFVTNNLQPKTSIRTTSGIGLTNINERYRLLLGREIQIAMDDLFFTVKLPLKA